MEHAIFSAFGSREVKRAHHSTRNTWRLSSPPPESLPWDHCAPKAALDGVTRPASQLCSPLITRQPGLVDQTPAAGPEAILLRAATRPPAHDGRPRVSRPAGQHWRRCQSKSQGTSAACATVLRRGGRGGAAGRYSEAKSAPPCSCGACAGCRAAAQSSRSAPQRSLRCCSSGWPRRSSG